VYHLIFKFVVFSTFYHSELQTKDFAHYFTHMSRI